MFIHASWEELDRALEEIREMPAVGSVTACPIVETILYRSHLGRILHRT